MEADGRTLIILAGGRATRLDGRAKPLLRIGSETIVDTVLARLGPLFGDSVIVANSPELYEGRGATVVPDEVLGQGPFRGILSGLKESRTKDNFVVAGDMPFVNTDLVNRMLELGATSQVVMPRLADGLQPLHAYYSSECTPVIQRFIKKNLQVISFLPAVKVKYMEEKEIKSYDPELLSFFNINTPEDLRQARATGERSKMGKN